MTAPRVGDGSAGDADYGSIGGGYANFRRADARIAAAVGAALGDAETVLNVGAGAGNYEPRDRSVTAVEPSETMRAQRAVDIPVAIDGVAEDLPFEDGQFDASMATFSVHQWRDFVSGLAEMRRVTRGPVVLLTCDPAKVLDFWLVEYCREVLELEASRYPRLIDLGRGLGGRTMVTTVAIPLDCTDGFNEAYYGRPELLLDRHARQACSAWSFVDDATVARFERELARDLASGEWDERFGVLRTKPEFDGSLVLVVAV